MPPAVPRIPPRQATETRAAYEKRRSVALTGKTPYQRRIERGLATGQTRTQARGQAPATGESEYERRARRSQEQYGQTPYQRRIARQDAWLTANGFTPVTTGLSWTALRKIQSRLQWINANTSANGGLTPDLMLEYSEMEREGELERGWITDRVFKRYDAMLSFMNGSTQPGNFYWFSEGGSENAGTPGAAWWFYH